jgi:hypothetical protein
MLTLSQAELLQIWELGLNLPSVDRTLVLLDAACRGSSIDTPAQWPIGQRDARLLALREQMFGPDISAVAECPKCAAGLELTFGVSGVRAEPTAVHDLLTVEDGAYQAEFRLPTSEDLLVIQRAGGTSSAAQTELLKRCLVSATNMGGSVDAEQLPESTISAISQRMSEADPQAEVDLPVECLECGHHWEERFEIDSFLWAEIHGWASRTLNEVHQLASAYGWSEAEIMALTPLRRSLYLNLVAE